MISGIVFVTQEWDQALKWCNKKGENRGVIVFVVSLVDYSYEDGHGDNRLVQALVVWQRLLHNQSIKGVPVILLLNKKDLLARRLSEHPMSGCSLYPFPEKKLSVELAEEVPNFTESEEEVAERCIEETAKLFKKEFQGQLEYYSTCATDGEMIKGTMPSMLNSMDNALSSGAGKGRGKDESKLLRSPTFKEDQVHYDAY